MSARLSTEAVMAMHAMLSRETGGDDGLREASLLESALGAAYATFGGEELYPTPEEKAARLGFSLIKNHAFADGNKRIGMLTMLTYLSLAGAPIAPRTGEVARVGLAVASGEMTCEGLLAWIRENRAL